MTRHCLFIVELYETRYYMSMKYRLWIVDIEIMTAKKLVCGVDIYLQVLILFIAG